MPKVVEPEAPWQTGHLSASGTERSLQRPGANLPADLVGDQVLSWEGRDVRTQRQRHVFRNRHGGAADRGLQLLGRVLHGRVDDPAHEIHVGHTEPAHLSQAQPGERRDQQSRPVPLGQCVVHLPDLLGSRKVGALRARRG